jgi:hypothetical protein
MKSEAEREWQRQYREDNYKRVNPNMFRNERNVEVRGTVAEFHEPCFNCGEAGACRHRRSYVVA